jgi:hypothetical protein
MRDFLRPFRSVRLLRLTGVSPSVQEIGLNLKQDEDGRDAIFPYSKKLRYQYCVWKDIARTRGTGTVRPKQWRLSSHANERVAW